MIINPESEMKLSHKIVISPYYSLESVSFSDFSEKDWKEYLTLDEIIENEVAPGDPYSANLSKKKLLLDPPNQYLEYWVIHATRDNNKIVGFAHLNVLTPEASDYEGNGQTVRTWFGVHPDYRRNRLGKAIIKILCQRGLELKKKEISFSTSTESGQKFMEQFTTTSVFDSAENRLDLDEVDWNQIVSYHEKSILNSFDSVIETYESIPDQLIDEYAKVQTDLLNDVPFGGLGLRFTISSEQIRKWETYNKSLGFISIIKISREKDGKISALTEIKYNPYVPTLVHQNLTGVLREYRGKNLGMRLKTEMLLTIKELFPETKLITTGNADSNAPILRINFNLGFKRLKSWKAYKFQLSELLQKL